MDEEHPLNPRSYAATGAGRRLAYYFVTYGLPIVICARSATTGRAAPRRR
jgi:hypothetical protein